MREEMIKICAIAALSAVCAIIVGHTKKELSFAVRVAGTVLIFGILFTSVSALIDELQGMFSFGEVSEYVIIMIKALGVAFVTHICATLCRDCGEGGLASGVELAGKLEILIISLPLISKVMGYVSEMLRMGE